MLKPDKYLIEFINYCKKKFKEDLVAIVIYGSYPWGYFDKNKSDYDVIIIFRDNIPKGKNPIKKKFKKISLQYYDNCEGLIKKVKLGHWSIYITLLTSGMILYEDQDYSKFLKTLKNINFRDELVKVSLTELKKNTEEKINYEIKILKSRNGFEAIKWALPSIRKKLQLLTYIKNKKLLWDLNMNLILNKTLNKEEKAFILNLDKKVKKRLENFNNQDKNKVIELLFKLNNEIINNLR